MFKPNWTVVKIGGSLFDMPDLGDRLRRFLIGLSESDVLLVPGGGSAADAIRELDRVHLLGEEVSHWLAIQALSLNACFLRALLPESRSVAEIPAVHDSEARVPVILDAFPFFRDEARPDHLPHHWQVTSDSLAARAAVLFGARELILLKSLAWERSDWPAAARAGVVDDYFVQALKQSPVGLKVRVVN